MVSIAKLNNFITVILKFRSLSTLRVILYIFLIIFVASGVINQNMLMKIIPNKITYFGVNRFLEFSCKVSLQD